MANKEFTQILTKASLATTICEATTKFSSLQISQDFASQYYMWSQKNNNVVNMAMDGTRNDAFKTWEKFGTMGTRLVEAWRSCHHWSISASERPSLSRKWMSMGPFWTEDGLYISIRPSHHEQVIVVLDTQQHSRIIYNSIGVQSLIVEAENSGSEQPDSTGSSSFCNSNLWRWSSPSSTPCSWASHANALLLVTSGVCIVPEVPSCFCQVHSPS